MRQAFLAVALAVAACGAPEQPPPPPPPTPTPTSDPVLDPADLPVRSHADLPLGPDPTPRPPSRLDHLRTLRPAFLACGRHTDALDERYAACACDVLCRARFAPAEATVSIRYPFVDVDGLAFTIEPSGRVSRCRYSIGARELARTTCQP